MSHGHSHGPSGAADAMDKASTFTQRLIILFCVLFAFSIWYASTSTVVPSPRPLADYDYCMGKNDELVRQMKLYEAQIDDLRLQITQLRSRGPNA